MSEKLNVGFLARDRETVSRRAWPESQTVLNNPTATRSAQPRTSPSSPNTKLVHAACVFASFKTFLKSYLIINLVSYCASRSTLGASQRTSLYSSSTVLSGARQKWHARDDVRDQPRLPMAAPWSGWGTRRTRRNRPASYSAWVCRRDGSRSLRRAASPSACRRAVARATGASVPPGCHLVPRTVAAPSSSLRPRWQHQRSSPLWRPG